MQNQDRESAAVESAGSDLTYRMVFAHSDEAVFIISGGLIVSCNPKSFFLTGCPPEELQGKNFIEIFHPDDRRQAGLDCESGPIEAHGFSAGRGRLIDSGGSVKWVDFRILKMEGRERTAVMVFMKDVTEQRLAEAALKRSRKSMEELFDFLPDATFAVDREGRVIAWNRAIEKMTGIAAKEILGKGGYEYSVPFYGERRPLLIDFVLNPEKDVGTNYQALERDDKSLAGEAEAFFRGSDRLLWGKAHAVYDGEHRLIGAVESIRDLTDQKKIEKELESKTEKLNEANTALKILLRHKQQDMKSIEEMFMLNIKGWILPYIGKLKISKLDRDQAMCLDIIERKIDDLLSPFIIRMISASDNFTPKEIQVAGLIADGKTTKEIAELLNVTAKAIDLHRANLRKKLGLKRKKINLQSHLLSLM